MPTTGMLKVVKHTVRMRKYINNRTIEVGNKPPYKITMYRSADNSHVKQIKQNKKKNRPFSIIQFLMFLITSLFVVEIYFFFMNFREGAADIVSR